MRNFPEFWEKVSILSVSLLRKAGLLAIGTYRIAGTTHLGGSCRFHPSCSEYAAEAWRLHAPAVAFRLIAFRLLRCRPGGPCGLDPVPPVRGAHAIQ